MAEPAQIGFLRIAEAATVLTENGLDARFDFGMAFRRKLWKIDGLLLRAEPARWIGKAPAKIRAR